MDGEDEGGGTPAKYDGLFGGETWGQMGDFGTYRFFLEWADTTCNFRLYKGSDREVANCAYNNSIYKTGYRHRGRSIGHTFDNDSSIFTLGSILTNSKNHVWQARVSFGDLNRAGNRDKRNTVARVKNEYRELQVNHQRDIGPVLVKLGAGWEYRENTISGKDDDDVTLFMELVYDY